jgi:hypothetical protein
MLDVLLNGEIASVVCDLPNARELREGLALAREGGGFAGRLRNRRSASARIVFDRVDAPERKCLLVNQLRGELLQRAIDGLTECDFTDGGIPSWTTAIDANGRIIVGLEAAGGAGSQLVDKLAVSLRTPLMRLIAPGAKPWLIVGTTLHREITVECHVNVLDNRALHAANDNGRPMAEPVHALKSMGRIGSASAAFAVLDNRRVLRASCAVADMLGLKGPTLTEKWLAHASRSGSEEPLVHWWKRGDALNVTLSAPDPTNTNHGDSETNDALVVGCVAVAASLGHAAEALRYRGLQLCAFASDSPTDHEATRHAALDKPLAQAG